MLMLWIGVKLKIEVFSVIEKGYDEEGGLDLDVDEFLQFENFKDEEEIFLYQDILMYMFII